MLRIARPEAGSNPRRINGSTSVIGLSDEICGYPGPARRGTRTIRHYWGASQDGEDVSLAAVRMCGNSPALVHH
jgi:hypothetical protein